MRHTEPGEAPRPAPVTNPTGVAHEPSDVRTRPIVAFVVGLLVSAVVISVGLWGLLRLFAKETTEEQPRVPPGVVRNLRRTPAEPRLEPLPLALRERVRAQEDAILSGYGWVDRRAGIARIPIEEAMRRIVERGVPGGKPMSVQQAPGAGGGAAGARPAAADTAAAGGSR